MRSPVATFFATCALLLTIPGTTVANESSLRDVYLTTDYPALSVEAGETASIGVNLSNHNLAPERFSLRVNGVPDGWKATLLGNGQPVRAAMPGHDDSLNLQLRLEVPQDTDPGPHQLEIVAESPGRQLRLPIDIELADSLPPQLTIETDLPQLTGSVRTSFDYQLEIQNDSGEDMLVSLAAEAPQYFDVSFTEGYGSQQISAVPIKAGESKNVKLNVRPPSLAEPGRHEISVNVSAGGASASTTLGLELTGQPELSLAGRDGLLSASAEAGKTSTVPLLLQNTGTVVATDISLSGNGPSGWNIEFEPANVPRIEPGETQTVQASITPSGQSLAGDYMVSVSARSQGQSADSDLRISVTTSTLWGLAGLAVIAVALLVLIGAIARYGRR